MLTMNQLSTTGLLFTLLIAALLPALSANHSGSVSGQSILIDDFQSYPVGEIPHRWKFLSSKTRTYEPLDSFMNENEIFYVVEERGNKFLRAYTNGEAQRISLSNENNELRWDVRDNPVLSWRWRANRLPEGASEKEANDTGAAVYVVFKTDWIGRPISIKYTYSSTLPVGTIVSFGKLKVIVVSSGRDGIGEWTTVERNIADDYKTLFGKNPPNQPLLITLWSDSDDTGSIAEVDFDDIITSSSQ